LIDGDRGASVTCGGGDAMLELLVVSGSVDVLGHRLTRLGWLRAARGRAIDVEFVEPGRVFVKARPQPHGRMNS